MDDLIKGATLTGIINGSSELVGVIQPAYFLRGVISICGAESSYEGDYIVTPRIHAQTLNTKNKLMKDNVSVLAIPYYETSNLSGKTVYIGGE